MKVLVTGASGFLGRRAAAFFREQGHSVLTPTHTQLDITEEAAVRDWFAENRPEAVIHTAAVSDVGACQQNPEWSERINVNGSVHLARACRNFGSRLVICSSDQVYFGSALPGPHREEEPLTPGNVYGRQKLRAERECLEIFPDTVCLRLSWMYSRDHFPNEHGHFITTLKASLEDPEKPLTWPIHDRRGLTDGDTVVRMLPAALNLPGGAWNFGAENTESTYETVKQLLTRLGLTEALARLKPNEEAFSEDSRDISMDLSKLHAAGIRFPSTLEGLVAVLEQEEAL